MEGKGKRRGLRLLWWDVDVDVDFVKMGVFCKMFRSEAQWRWRGAGLGCG